MAVLVDAVCDTCGFEYTDVWSTLIGKPCTCGGTLERLWTLTRAPNPNAHPSERCVVYVSESEGGRIQYPGRNDLPVPERLRRRGYERVEINPQQLGRFERKHGLVNERRHFDRNGRGF